MIGEDYKVYIDFGSGLVAHDAQYKDFTKTEMLHKGLKGADNSCTFSLVPSVSLANNLRTIGRSGALVSISKAGVPYFYGYIRKTFALRRAARLQPIKIEVVSPSFRLKRKIKEALYFSNFTVSDPVHPETSVLHTLFTRAGVSLERVVMPAISYTIPVYYIEENSSTWYALIEELLFQYGYIVDFDEFGRAITRNIVPTNTVPVFTFATGTSGNVIGTIESQIKEEEKDIVEVEWSELETIQNAVVFSDTSGATPTSKAEITLGPSERYGSDDGSGMFAELSVENRELVYASDCVYDILCDDDITVDLFEPFPKRVKLSIKNHSAVYARKIRKLDIKATAVVLKAKNKSKIKNADTEYSEAEKVDGNRIFTRAAADALCSSLAWYFKYSDFTYSLSSKENVSIGTVVTITDSELGTVVARIIAKKTDERTGVIVYELEAIADYVPSAAEPSYYLTERETLPRKTYEEAIAEIAQQLLDLAHEDVDFHLSLEAVRNGDLIDGAVDRAKLDTSLQDELNAVQSEIFPNGMQNESKIDLIEPRTALNGDMIDEIMSLINDSEEQLIFTGREISLVTSKVDEDRTRIASLRLDIDSITQIVSELVPLQDGQIANLSKIEQTSEAIELLVTTGKYLSESGIVDAYNTAQLSLLKDRFEVFVSGSGSDYDAATWIMTHDEIVSTVQDVIETDESVNATIAQMIQNSDSISLLVKESRELAIEDLDNAMADLQAGIVVTAREVQLGVQDLDAKVQSLLTVQSDRITALTQDFETAESAIVQLRSNQIDAQVAGGGALAQMSLSVTLPVTIDAVVRNAMQAAAGKDTVDAVYVLTGNGFWRILPSATVPAQKTLITALREADLLGSQIRLTADEILLDGSVLARHIDVDDLNAAGVITVGTSQVTGLGSLATKNSVSATTEVTGLGTLATKNSVTIAEVLELQNTLNAKEAAGAAETAKAAVAQKIGYASWSDMEAAATLGQTIIQGGKIRTSLIETDVILGQDAVFSGSLNAATGTFSGTLNAASGIFSGSIESGPLELTISPPVTATVTTSEKKVATFVDELITSGISPGRYTCSGVYAGANVKAVEFLAETLTENMGSVENYWYKWTGVFDYLQGYKVENHKATWTGFRNRTTYRLRLYNESGSVVADLSDSVTSGQTVWNLNGSEFMGFIYRWSTDPEQPETPAQPAPELADVYCSTGSLSFTNTAFTMKYKNLPAYSPSLPQWTAYVASDGSGNYILKVKG